MWESCELEKEHWHSIVRQRHSNSESQAVFRKIYDDPAIFFAQSDVGEGLHRLPQTMAAFGLAFASQRRFFILHRMFWLNLKKGSVGALRCGWRLPLGLRRSAIFKDRRRSHAHDFSQFGGVPIGKANAAMRLRDAN